MSNQITWIEDGPDEPGWWVYRDQRGCWLCYCENDGSELTWRGEIPPGDWLGLWFKVPSEGQG